MKQIPSNFAEVLMKLDDVQLEIMKATFDSVWDFDGNGNLASERGIAAWNMREEIHAEIARREDPGNQPHDKDAAAINREVGEVLERCRAELNRQIAERRL